MPAPLVLVREAEKDLEAAGCDTPRLDAEILVAHALGTDREGLFRLPAEPMPPDLEAAARALVARRSAREPVSRITGRRWFRMLEIELGPEVLTPRPETELLVEWAIGLPPGASVADIGTGSGAVALAIADERPDLAVVGTDISAEALGVAQANAARLGLDVDFREGDLLDALPGRVDAVVANLPYVPFEDRELLDPEVRDHDPDLALFAADGGLAQIRRLIIQAAQLGIESVALELGAGQADSVSGMLVSHGWGQVSVIDDLAGIGRVATGRGRA